MMASTGNSKPVFGGTLYKMTGIEDSSATLKVEKLLYENCLIIIIGNRNPNECINMLLDYLIDLTITTFHALPRKNVVIVLTCSQKARLNLFFMISNIFSV